VQRRTDTVHSSLCSVAQGAGATTMHQAGVAAAAARLGVAEPVAVGHVQPQAVVPQPAAADEVPAAGVQPQPLSVGLSSSRHHREENHSVEVQR
jgi:hypothetical protein